MTEVTHILSHGEYFENIMYCGAVNGEWISTIWPDNRFVRFIEKVTCEDCKAEYGLRLLGDLP